MGFLGDVVLEFPKSVAHGQLRGDLGNRKSSGLAGQSARSTDPGIHLDDDHPTRCRVNRKLDIRTPCLDSDFANNRQACVSHALVFFVGQGLGRGHGDRIASVDPHGIEVFDRTDDHDVVLHVAHHLHLVLLPTDDRFLDQDLGNWRKGQSILDQ